MRVLAAAALMMVAQALPVTRLAGGVAEQGGAQPAAQPPAPPGLPVTQLDPGAAAMTLDSPRRLTLSFAEPRPTQEVMRLLVAGTPFSLAVDADIAGTFQGELKQLTLREALHALLDPLGLDFELHGTVIRVRHDHTELRQFDLNLLAVQRALTRTAGAGSMAVVTTAQADDVFAAAADGVRALLSPSGHVHIDRRAGLAQVTDYPERLDRVALYLEALQVRSGRQVRLEARVFEVTLRDAAAAIDWRAVREKLGFPRDAPQAGLAAHPYALQAALAEQGDIRVLSAPEVTALNNEPALVRAGTPGVSSLTLTVVPQIAADGVVQLSVSHTWEEQDGSKAPHTAEADTVTRVVDGSTVMISGLLRPAQIPAPGRGMGALFGGAAKKTVQAELVVLLRATVVTPGTR